MTPHIDGAGAAGSGGPVRARRTTLDPTRHGLAFPNRFGWGRSRTVVLTRAGAPRSRGRHAYGLCGGMAYAALDYYHAGQRPPEATSPPAPGTPFWRYLLRRQWDSWQGPVVPLRTLRWALASDGRLARRTREREWPRLQARIDRGEPAVVLLIRTRNLALALNHQVVVSGYEEDLISGRVLLHVYDPNRPGVPVTLAFRAGPTGAPLGATQSTGEPLRGFLVLPYRPRRRGLPASVPPHTNDKENVRA